MKDKLNEIKDLVYEAEGLLELLQQRPDKKFDICPLIAERLTQAAGILKNLNAESQTAAPEAMDIAAVESNAGDSDELYIVEAATMEKNVISADYTSSADNPSSAGVIKTKMPPSFCLNDRYRFRRSIFGGSDAEFNAIMEHLTTLDSYREAEELFLVDMALNPEDPDVVDFMAIIKDYYKE